MRKIGGIASFGVVLAMVVAPIEASANSVGVVAFFGKCHLSRPIWLPILPTTGSPAAMKCWFGTTPDIAGKDNGTPSGWVGVKAGPTKGKLETSSSAVLTGSVDPFVWLHCGINSGSISAVDNTGTTYRGTWATAVGAVRVIVGTASRGNQSGPLAWIVNDMPDTPFKGQSCVSGATQFFVVGAGVVSKFGTGK